jgi:TonB family protein
MKRTSDKSLTFALGVSLLVHAGLWVYMLRDQVNYLTRQLHRPALVDAHKTNIVPAEDDDSEPTPFIQPADPPPLQTVFDPPTPLPPPQKAAKNPADDFDIDNEWGEKNAKGFAITSAPGEQPLQARKGLQDQAFASRDPKGPGDLPDEPSMSLVPPGQNGDGKPIRDALAGAGTDGAPVVVIGPPDAAPTPPPPPPLPERRNQLASATNNSAAAEITGQATSRLPAPEQRSAASINAPPADGDGPTDASPSGPAMQLLPVKRIDVIAIRSAEQAYPEVVPALTQAPGLRIARLSTDPPHDLVLPDVAPSDVRSGPAIQPATVALGLPPARALEEMARLVGQSDPTDAPAIGEALTQLPADSTRDGGEAALPELASADAPGARPIQEAIATLIDERRPVEMAQLLEQQSAPGAAPTAVALAMPTKGPPGSAASATGGAPGPQAQAADRAPDTGLESDPFAKLPNVEFRDGKVEARNGRQVKPIRPRLTEAARRDLLALQFPTILLKVRIDKTGKPTDVTVLRGSGSDAIDMPVYRALWGWWFEPPIDKNGKPTEDVQLVAIHWS